MEITSWKKSIITGLLNALITFTMLTVYVCFIHYVLLNGKEFIGKNQTVYFINGISFYCLIVIGVFLSAVVPITFLKYSSAKYLVTYCIFSSITYTMLYIFILSFGKHIFSRILYPLETFDAIIYALFSFPLGSVIGTTVSIIVHFIRRKRG